VGEFASSGLLSVRPDASLDAVARLMSSNRIHAIAVDGDEPGATQVISDADLVAAAVSEHFDQLSARDVAITEPVSVGHDEQLGRAAQLLTEHAVSHLIVTNRVGEPIGVLSTLDIARAIARGGEDG
jgi:predicted transcriptional regulator